MRHSILMNSSIVALYCDKTPTSARLAGEAEHCFPSGVTHDSRHLRPYGVYIERAAGSRKWDVDGNEYVDFVGGHGALLLGHNRYEVIAATERALDRGTHFGSGHRLEIQWAQAVQKLLPGAERVRFTSSGTEATLMAVRLARAFTGKSKIIHFATHFHGWQDHVTSGHTSHFDGTPTPGVLAEIARHSVILPQNEPERLRATLKSDPDIAAVIIEPTGAGFGRLPIRPEFLRDLRAVTDNEGVILIFDEVVTGFRVSPGGAQELYDVRPDLTTLAKILAGGLPGGAVVGRKDLLDLLDFEASAAAGHEKISHPGTFNANPVSAAAGLATLEIIASTDACARADACASAIRAGFNRAIKELGVAWAAYGTSSGVHLFTNPTRRPVNPQTFDPFSIAPEESKTSPPELLTKLRLAMLVSGVDCNPWPGAMVSAAHGPEDVEKTVEAFHAALTMLRAEGDL